MATEKKTMPETDETRAPTPDETPAPDEARTPSPAGEEAVEVSGEAPDEALDKAGAEPGDEMARARAEISGLKDQLLRALAETENTRRRAAREREETSKYAITGFARDLLTVVDNLRRALDALPEESRKDESLAAFIEGIEMTEREFLAVLERHGIRRIEPLGERFDHRYHQAMYEIEDAERDPGTVVDVMQAGYLIADRLLRPAMVAVAKAADKSKARVDTEA